MKLLAQRLKPNLLFEFFGTTPKSCPDTSTAHIAGDGAGRESAVFCSPVISTKLNCLLIAS
jgi:hypothetical protein